METLIITTGLTIITHTVIIVIILIIPAGSIDIATIIIGTIDITGIMAAVIASIGEAGSLYKTGDC